MTSLIASSSQLPAGDGLFLSPAAERSRPKELVGIILQRLWPAIGVAAAVVVVIMLVVFSLPPSYTATGALLIQPKRQNLATTNAPPPDGLPPDTSAIDTQVEVLKSPALAVAVTRRLRLYNDPEFNPALKGKMGTAAQPPAEKQLDLVAAVVAEHVHIKRQGLTYVVQVGFSSRSPRKAELVANAYMDTFLQRQLDEKVAVVTRANDELNAQVERMREEAEQAEAKVQQYKIANKLYSAEGSTMAEQVVSNLNQQIAAAQAEAAEKEARYQAALQQVRAGSGGADVSAAVSNDTIRELRKAEADKSEQLAQLEADFKPEYPAVKRAQAELNDIRQEIQSELNRILSSVHADALAAQQREESLASSRGQAQGGLMANNKAEVGLLALQQRADAAKEVYQAYLNRANQVAAEGSLQQPDAIVSSPADLPLKPSSPNKKLGAAVAMLMGLMAAAATIVATELWDRRLRSRTDVETRLGVPFAGVLPQAETRRRIGRAGSESAAIASDVVQNRFSSFAEAFRNLRAFLTFADNSPNSKVLGVTSALPREGKSVTSLCLARTLALSGAKVALVDCDLRRRGLSKTTGAAQIGVAEVIQGKATLDQAMVQDPASGCWILPASAVGPLPYDLFSGEQADQLFADLARHFDQVVLDLPPVLGLADARILAAKADRVIYLVHWNKTPARTAQSGLDVLRECGANVVGAVLTQVNVNQQARYGYCDSSDYFKHYRQYYLPARG